MANVAKVVDICARLLPLAVESRYLSQVEIKILLLQAEQFHKMTLKMVLGENSSHFVNFTTVKLLSS